MKRLLLIIIFIAISISAYSQPFGNEWINYNQKYYKFKIYENNIYHISYNTLLKSGVPLGSFDPRSIQILGKGAELYIYVKGQDDGKFDADDYIEFYAEKNDGWFDAQLFHQPNSCANPEYSLFTDTATYYLTWNSSINNKRMILESDTNFIDYTPASYFYRLSRQDYTNVYFNGKIFFKTTDTEYTTAEGWFDEGFWKDKQEIVKKIPTSDAYVNGPDADIKIVLVSASDIDNMLPDHHVRCKFADVNIDTLFDGYKIISLNTSIPAAKLNTTSTNFSFTSIDDLGYFNNPDRNTIAYISVKYPHTFNLANFSTLQMFVPNSTLAVKSFLKISNLNVNSRDTIRLFDITNHKKILTKKYLSYIQALVPNGAGEKECYITSDKNIININSLMPVSTNTQSYAMFTNYNSAIYRNSDYIIITHKLLMSSAYEYKAYRTLTGYNPLLVDVEELYDQFSYGICKHPLAIRNFCRFAINKFNDIPKSLFIIGKSYRAGENCGAECSYRHDSYYFEHSLVPSFGNPPSDILFTNRILDSLYQPAIPSGRLAAKTNSDVQLYLNNMIQYEDSINNNPREWMKQVLHFGGGSTMAEQNQLSSYLNIYKNIIEDTLFGGCVRTFLKNSTAPMTMNTSDSLKKIINNGVSLMTFFGHASGTMFDQDIDNPSEYTNYGRYPFLLANSCLAGDLFSGPTTSSESFVLIANKGVIGYLASATPSVADALNIYSTNFYKNIGMYNYGKPVGKCIQQTIKSTQNNLIINSNNIKNVCLAMTLHGDPAVVINSHSKPDYVITLDKIYFNPTEVTSEMDSFNVYVISTNIGRAIVDSFFVEVVRTFPDNTTQIYLQFVPATFFKDTFSFKLPVDKAKGVGLNYFKITLDAYHEINELSENNNTVFNIPLLIKSYHIIPIYPYKYAIIPNATVTLKASTGNLFASTMNYVFQIDTTDAFNSPSLKYQTVNHSGGVITWSPPIILTDSTVYYWRVSPDSAYTGNFNWRESSFQYIVGKHGWGQAHFFQFKNDDYEYVFYNKPSRRWDFVNNVLSINAQAGTNVGWKNQWYKINGTNKYIWSHIGMAHGMIVADIDPVSVVPRDTIYDNEIGYAFDFIDDTLGRNNLKNFLNAIPNGHYVLVYTHRSPNIPAFGESLFQAFDAIGSGYIRNAKKEAPYIIFGRKGNPIGSANEVLGTSTTNTIVLNDNITTNWKNGYIRSELIGPAIKWSSLHWRHHPLNGITTDIVTLDVIGIKLSGQEDTVIHSIPSDSMDIALTTRIDASIYPYIKLLAHMNDDAMHTAAQMNRWQVLYEGVPETALDPSIHFSFFKDTLQEGDSIKFSTATHNISEYNMDSLLIKYWIVDKNRNAHLLYYKKQRPHPADDTLITHINASTVGLSGQNILWIEVNPDNNQLEQYHFNNIGQIYFFVNTDKINPILDVTFDNVHILNGDIISAKPTIQIKLNDENKFLALDDTADFRISLRSPSTNTMSRIFFYDHINNKYNINFTPAHLPDNSFRIDYNPVFTKDGIYELNVSAKDKSNNESGDIEYKISFEVVNKSTITEVMNWPNPFSTATHFVFELTGSETPTYFKIQIMTITGKIVREINLDELGPIHIGKNITEFAWNGKDQFGDQLANGIYLYRVITNINSDAIEKNNTETDKYFTKNFGKMYLIR